MMVMQVGGRDQFFFDVGFKSLGSLASVHQNLDGPGWDGAIRQSAVKLCGLSEQGSCALAIIHGSRTFAGHQRTLQATCGYFVGFP
jgi:hypothetical protein